MLAPSGFSPAHVILVVFATLGESQATDIAQLNFFGLAFSRNGTITLVIVGGDKDAADPVRH